MEEMSNRKCQGRCEHSPPMVLGHLWQGQLLCNVCTFDSGWGLKPNGHMLKRELEAAAPP